jgi:Flp pilus assembly protein TadG
MINKKKNNRRGTTVVETVFVLPLLIILTFGGIKYGWLFMRHQQLTNAARQVARVAIRPGDRTASISSMFVNLMTSANITGAQVTANPTGGKAAIGGNVTVTVSIPDVSASNVDLLKILYLPAPSTMTATVTMSKEG